MAVDSAILYNDCYCYLRDSMGQSYGGASAEQIHNAEKIYNLLRVLGYSAAAACGILGNMQTESGLSPAALSGNLAALPNNGEHFSDILHQKFHDFIFRCRQLDRLSVNGQFLCKSVQRKSPRCDNSLFLLHCAQRSVSPDL